MRGRRLGGEVTAVREISGLILRFPKKSKTNCSNSKH